MCTRPCSVLETFWGAKVPAGRQPVGSTPAHAVSTGSSQPVYSSSHAQGSPVTPGRQACRRSARRHALSPLCLLSVSWATISLLSVSTMCLICAVTRTPILPSPHTMLARPCRQERRWGGGRVKGGGGAVVESGRGCRGTGACSPCCLLLLPLPPAGLHHQDHQAAPTHPPTQPPSHPATQPPSHPATQPATHLGLEVVSLPHHPPRHRVQHVVVWAQAHGGGAVDDVGQRAGAKPQLAVCRRRGADTGGRDQGGREGGEGEGEGSQRRGRRGRGGGQPAERAATGACCAALHAATSCKPRALAVGTLYCWLVACSTQARCLPGWRTHARTCQVGVTGCGRHAAHQLCLQRPPQLVAVLLRHAGQLGHRPQRQPCGSGGSGSGGAGW